MVGTRVRGPVGGGVFGDAGCSSGPWKVAIDDDAGVSGGSGSCEAICCCSSSSAGTANACDKEVPDGSLLVVGSVVGHLWPFDRTNRSTSDGLTLSLGRMPSMGSPRLQQRS